MDMGNKFDDKIVWITGASSGIGRETALEFAREGAHVAVSARRREKLEEVASAIEDLGRDALVVPCDVTEVDQIAAAVDSVVDTFGRIDVALANAGYSVGGKIEDLEAEELRRQLDVNVVGLTMTAKHTIPELKKTDGRLGLVGSVAGIVAPPGSGAYAASKYAVRAIGQVLAVELHETGVSCTTIHPGFVESDIAKVDNKGEYHEDWTDKRPQKLMWPTDKAARKMVHAMYKRKREYVFTGHGKVAAALGKHAPGLVHFAMTTFGE
jgi:NAD(P)-dependent dehydrogenase (short-subunit alcohol dehydrogenase family)